MIAADLYEILQTRQIPGEPRRRWFTSDALDLFVWFDDSGSPWGFQLCYGKPISEHALTWTPKLGFLHAAVDDGEDGDFHYKATPILVADRHFFDANRVSELFAKTSAKLPPEIVDFVSAKIRQHPNYEYQA